MLQEFWDICHAEDSGDCTSELAETSDAQVLLALSVAALNGKSVINAIQFQGLIQGYTAQILIDLGSSHTFVSASFAPQLQGQTSFSPPLQVKIADAWPVSALFLRIQTAGLVGAAVSLPVHS